MSQSHTEKKENSKVIRLMDFFLRMATLRTKLIRDVADYEKTLWFSDIPSEKGCFTQAWGRNEEIESDIWLEIQNQKEPELPSPPVECEGWVKKSLLRIKTDIPELLAEITIQIDNPSWQEGDDVPEYIFQNELIEEHPEVQRIWEQYVERRWLPWMEEHNRWESVHRVYSALFAIHQEQIRLGEEYELVLGLGLLTWKLPTSPRVCRHLITANAILEFEPQHQRFTVHAHPDGTKLRPELDMLDIEDRPTRAEETAIAALVISESDEQNNQIERQTPLEDPWEKSLVEGVLMGLTHSLSSVNSSGESVHGEYQDKLEKSSTPATSKPVVGYAPALILRKRSSRGLTETLKKIRDSIENGVEISSQFSDLAEIERGVDFEPNGDDSDPGTTNAEFDGEIFFPKPSNEEQRRIVDKIRKANGVLVQGPPGTGKSHTIANLVSHLLATGNRILVTAKTPRALQVLMGEIGLAETQGAEKKKDSGLIPQELRPLCINLLGSGQEERRSLESSVNGILCQNDKWDVAGAAHELRDLEERLQALREEKATVNRRIRDIRESETFPRSVAEGAYHGTAARIAEAVNGKSGAYDWFTDAAALDKPCPVSDEDNLRSFLSALRFFTPEKRKELSLKYPEALPDPECFANFIESEAEAQYLEENNMASSADEVDAALLVRANPSSLDAIRDTLSNLNYARKNILVSPDEWVRDALPQVLNANSSVLRELANSTRGAITAVESFVSIADGTTLDIPDGMNVRALHEDACTLKKHVEKGESLGWGLVRPKVVRERIHVIKTVRINGRPCRTLEDFSRLVDVLHVRIEFEKAWGFWLGRVNKAQGPYSMQLQGLKSLCDTLGSVLAIESHVKECREVLRLCPALSEPVWSDESQVGALIASCRLALIRQRKQRIADEFKEFEAPASYISGDSDSHEVTNTILQAIRNRDKDAYAESLNTVQRLDAARQRLQKVDEYLHKLHRLLPELAEKLQKSCDDPCWDERIREVRDAWHWAQARHWVEDYIRKEDAPALARRARQIEDDINSSIEKLASLHAWSYCHSRLRDDHRSHLEGWQQAMSRFGKGTGKHAARHRRDAQRHLDQCREAVPAWVMPLYRVWDTVDPTSGMFDVVIVDEASQCGLEALPLLYLGKKVLVVGDDKQISPEAVATAREPVHQLMEEYLYDFRFKDSFAIENSLFAHGKLRFGTQRITLREHFRCMPEIIRFSNDNFYADTPLIPLRQFGSDRLAPLAHIFVDGGFREGKGSRVLNRPEADAIVKKIIELCGDERYRDMTMGVIVLQGDAQAGWIEGELLKHLGAEEMGRRRLVCGNPYSFQGDERHVIFLSMVAAPNERIGPLTKPADERRFNVAASRARDQMYLFHSVRSDDLSENCLRRKLLEFFENTKPREIAGIDREDLEREAYQANRRVEGAPRPFDSWFEVDVALELVRKGYEVIPQYEFAGRRIDLVVQDGPRQLAVECDGDHWHGLEQDEADTFRERQLVRCGWEFFRVTESAFYANKDYALAGLWRALEERGIIPGGSGDSSTESSIEEETDIQNTVEPLEESNEEEPDAYEEKDVQEKSPNNGHKTSPLPPKALSPQPRRGPSEIATREISDAILQALVKRPKHTCTLESLPGRVLKEVGVITRGKPRLNFEKRVNRVVTSLEKKGIVEKYKAKNIRVRLLLSTIQESLPID